MPSHDHAIERLRFQLAARLILKQAIGYATFWLFLWGTAVLVLRAALGTERLPLLWGLAGLPVVVVPAVILAWRRLPARAELRAALDRHNGCGGLLMAAGEVPIGAWGKRMPALAVPAVRWRAGRAGMLLFLAAGFLCLTFLVPQRFANLIADNPLEIGREAEKLAKQIDVLKEERILEPERAQDLKKKLDQLRDDASGRDPVKTLEALDHLQNMVQETGKTASQEMLRKKQKLSKTEALAEALDKKKNALEPKFLRRALEELAAMTQQAAEEDEQLQRTLDEETLKECQNGKLDPEKLKKLAKALRGAKKGLAGRLEKLREIDLADLEFIEMCEKCGECDSDALAKFLEENAGKLSVAELVKIACAGRGGVDEGPGTAPVWGNKTTEEGVTFKEQALPPAALAALKESKLLGLSKEAPQLDPKAGPSKSGALQAAPAGGGSAHTQVVLPRHRGTVERYFERPK